MAKKSKESSILNVGFGVLNPLGDTMSGKNFDSHSTTSLDAVRRATSDHFAEKIIPSAGRFVGIVLRNDGRTKFGTVNPTHWSKSTTLLSKKDSSDEAPNLIQIRVRIPELHGHLPIPDFLPNAGDFSEKGKKAHDIINMYPCFVGVSEELTIRGEPDPGSLVWVDFQNRATFQGPIYLDKVGLDVGYDSDGEKIEVVEEFGTASKIDTLGLDTEVEAEATKSGTTVKISIGKPIIKDPSRYKFGTFDNGQGIRQNRVFLLAFANAKGKDIELGGKLFKGEDVGLEPVPSEMAFPGYSPTVHPLLIPRLEQLNSMWQAYYDSEGLGSKTIPDHSALRDVGGGQAYTRNLTISSGYRSMTVKGPGNSPIPLDNEGFRIYCKQGREKYEYPSCREFASKNAFFTPHQTGLCVDFRGNGLKAVGSSTNQQAQTETHKFLRQFAWLCGFYPLGTETWHYECLVPREAFFTGEEFIDNPKYGTQNLPKIIIVGSGTTLTEDEEAEYKNGNFVVIQNPAYDFLSVEEGWAAGFEYAVWVEEWVTDEINKKTSNSSYFRHTPYYTPVGGEKFSVARIPVLGREFEVDSLEGDIIAPGT